MSNQNFQRFLVLLAFAFAFQFAAAQQRAKIVDMPDVVEIDLSEEAVSDVDWGDLQPGTMMRCHVSAENTTAKPMTLVRVLSQPGCFTAGLKAPMRDLVLEPGDKAEFYVMTSVQEPGQYNLKNELIVEIDGVRYRRGVFNYTGFVNASNE